MEALKIFNDRDQGAFLEALVLGRASTAAIARRMKLPLEYVRAYENLFFDVRESLHYRDYVLRWGIAREWSVGAADSVRRRVAMKALAYLCGPKALDDIFGLENEKSISYWTHPSDAVKRLATEHAVCQIADLIPHSGDRSSGRVAGPALTAIIALLQDICPHDYPRHEIIYAMRGMSP